MPSSKVLVDKLDNDRKKFTADPFVLDDRQEKAISKCIRLLREEFTSESLQSTTQYTRNRARRLLVDIYDKIDPDVFMLCILAITITVLGSTPTDGLVRQIRSWWLSKPHPASLSQLTKEVCGKYKINALVKPSHEIRQPTGLDSEENRLLQTQLHGGGMQRVEDVVPIEFAQQELCRAPSTTHLPAEAQVTNLSDVSDMIVPDIPKEGGYSPMDITSSELLGFMHSYASQPVDQTIILPYLGKPLPSIIMKRPGSAQVDAKLVISQELATAFIEYLRVSRGGAEVSNRNVSQ